MIKTKLPNTGDSLKVYDIRDGSVYTVKKLADGNVWMTDNLRIAGKTITSEDSNLPSGTSYTIPVSDIDSNKYDAEDQKNAVYVDPEYGGFYTFYAATASWGTPSVNINDGSSPQDICPKGWRLPTRDDFLALIDTYTAEELLTGDPGYVLSGSWDIGHRQSIGEYSIFRSSSLNDSGTSLSSVFSIRYNTSRNPVYLAYMTDWQKIIGYSIRCMAK